SGLHDRGLRKGGRGGKRSDKETTSLPVAASHTLTIWLEETKARQRPSALSARRVTDQPGWLESEAVSTGRLRGACGGSSWPLTPSHAFPLLRSLSRLPSGLKLKLFPTPVPPERLNSSRPVSASHAITVPLSLQPQARRWPSGLKTRRWPSCLKAGLAP